MFKKTEKNIYYNPKDEVYIVNIGFGKDRTLQAFGTLEEARQYLAKIREDVMQLKVEKEKAKIRFSLDKQIKKIMKEPEYPLNLLQDIFSEYDLFELGHKIDFSYYVEPGEQFYVALEVLNQREEEVVVKYYRDKRTLEDIGNDYGITKERIRQILLKSLRRIKFEILKIESKKEKARKEQLLKEVIEQDFIDLQEQRKKYVEALDKWGLLDPEAEEMFITEAYKEKELLKRKQEKLNDKSIDEYDLSLRSYNVLKRHCLDTRNKVIDYIKSNGKDWFKKIRNCGLKSKREIEERFGVKYE